MVWFHRLLFIYRRVVNVLYQIFKKNTYMRNVDKRKYETLIFLLSFVHQGVWHFIFGGTSHLIHVKT